MAYLFLNGKFLEENQAQISLTAPGVLFGFGLFETVRAYEGKIFRAEAHWERLFEGAQKLGLNLDFSSRELTESCERLLRKNRRLETAIRVSLYKDKKKDQLVIHLRKSWRYPSALYKTGAQVILSSYSLDEKSPLSKFKTTNRLVNFLAHEEAERKGALEALLLNTQGRLAEGTRSNIFLVSKGHLLTPPLTEGALAGVTRQAVIELVEDKSLKLKEKKLKPLELFQAEEAFLSSTLLEIMPVTLVDNKKIGSGSPGPLTLSLLADYRHLVAREINL